MISVDEGRHTRECEEGRGTAGLRARLIQSVLIKPAVERVDGDRPLLREGLRHVEAHRIALQAFQILNRSLLRGVADAGEKVRAGVATRHVKVRVRELTAGPVCRRGTSPISPAARLARWL